MSFEELLGLRFVSNNWYNIAWDEINCRLTNRDSHWQILYDTHMHNVFTSNSCCLITNQMDDYDVFNENAWFEAFVVEVQTNGQITVRIKDLLQQITNFPVNPSILRLRPHFLPIRHSIDSPRLWNPHKGTIVEVKCFRVLVNPSEGGIT